MGSSMRYSMGLNVNGEEDIVRVGVGRVVGERSCCPVKDAVLRLAHASFYTCSPSVSHS